MGLEGRAGRFLTRRDFNQLVLGTGLSLGLGAAGIMLQGDTVSPEQQLRREVSKFKHDIQTPGHDVAILLEERIIKGEISSVFPNYPNPFKMDTKNADVSLDLKYPLVFSKIVNSDNGGKIAFLHLAYFTPDSGELVFNPFDSFAYHSSAEYRENMQRRNIAGVSVKAYEKELPNTPTPSVVVLLSHLGGSEPIVVGKARQVQPK